WGPKLCEYVSGEAEELIEHISATDLCTDDGYKKVLLALDEKYLTCKQEEIQHYLKEYFYKCFINTDSLQCGGNCEALVLTSSNGSLKHKDVLEAVSRVLPEGKCSVAPRAKCISTVEDGDHAGWVNTQSEVFEVTDSVNDVFEAIAEYVQDHDGDYEDGLEVFKSYSEIRRKVQSQKESGQRLQALSSLQLRSNG
ncbi:Uncharacterized protein SCF082_LOCUS13379, partial [Durusdinium trenchii]